MKWLGDHRPSIRKPALGIATTALLGLTLLAAACTQPAAPAAEVQPEATPTVAPVTDVSPLPQPPVAVPAGHPAQVQRVSVQLNEFGFAPARIVVPANRPVEVTVSNLGQVEHDWVPQGLNQEVHTHVRPGESATVRFTPTQAGTFRVVCTEAGHESAGMVGELVVEP